MVLFFYLNILKVILKIIKLDKNYEKNECFFFYCIFLNIFGSNDQKLNIVKWLNVYNLFFFIEYGLFYDFNYNIRFIY